MNKKSTLGRMILAFAAILAVAGSGMVFASNSGAAYLRPKFAEIVGPGTVSPSSVTAYTLLVTFTDNSTGTFVAPLVTWGPPANWTGSNFMAPASVGRITITAKYTSAGATVTSNRSLSIQ